jgi:predicted dehydrogenase
MSRVRIAVAGAGLIGRRHIEEVNASDAADLASIVDPGPAGPELAEKYGVTLYQSLAELFDRDKPDGSSWPRRTRCTSTAAWSASPPECR